MCVDENGRGVERGGGRAEWLAKLFIRSWLEMDGFMDGWLDGWTRQWHKAWAQYYYYLLLQNYGRLFLVFILKDGQRASTVARGLLTFLPSFYPFCLISF